MMLFKTLLIAVFLCTNIFAQGKTYVLNPGESNQFYQMSQTLQAGDIAIFEDGIYYENQMANFLNSGTAEAPIMLKARNKHKAVIIYEGSNRQDIYIQKEFIEIRDFDITQDKKGTSTSNNIIRIYRPGGNIKIIDDVIWGLLKDRFFMFHHSYKEKRKT